MQNRRPSDVDMPPNPAGALEQLFLYRSVHEVGTGHPSLPSRSKRLRIFHFNDLHNALQVTRAGATAPLFSRIVRRYRDARGAAGDDEVVLLLSGGDDHTGTPFDELLGWAADELIIDPAYEAYSAAGVDMAALGNHDLDRGSAVLAAGIERSAAFPILSTNVVGSTNLVAGRHYFPAAIGIAKGLRIGFIGLTTNTDTRIGTRLDPTLAVTSPIEALESWLPVIAHDSDVVVILSHCGYGFDDAATAMTTGHRHIAQGDVALARAAARITGKPTVIVGGHTHTVLNSDALQTIVDGIPILQAGGHGSHVGEFVATIVPGKSREHWRPSARLHALGGAPRNPGAWAVVDDPLVDHEFERDVIGPLLARVQARIEDVIGTWDGDPMLSRERTLVDRYRGECALGNFIADALVARSREFAHGPVDLAIVNSTAIADGLLGPDALTFSDWYRVQPFADCLRIVTLCGAQLERILQSNAQRIVRPEELAGARQLNLDGYVSRGFLHFSKRLRYTIQLSGNAREASAIDATIDDRPLSDLRDTAFRVVLTNYVGTGGEGWNGDPVVAGGADGFDMRRPPCDDTGLVFRNELIAHIRAVSSVGKNTGALFDGRVRTVP